MNCPSGKRVLLNELDAEDALVESRVKSQAGALNIYKCEFCNYWHLTSKGDDLLVGREDLIKRVELGILGSKYS